MANARGLERWLPGLRLVRTYRREWLGSDLVAGLSVAAVALPIGIAYAQLAGFPPVVGIYSCILPAVAYALFGSSRQLVVNPDAAACAMIAATVAPLAAGDAARYADLAIVLTLLTGVLCIVGGLAGFGVIANFLSRPILTGYLNGIALSIIAGQLGTLLGYHVESGGFFRTVGRVVERIGQTHMPTLLLGLALFAIVVMLKRTMPRVPAPLVAAVVGITAVYAMGLGAQGVAVVGAVPAGFPVPHIPTVSLEELSGLFSGACGIMLVSFCSMMTTARGFAARNGYGINSNQDLIALGAADIVSGLSRGFAVSGADSRTAVADASGGKTQLATIVAALVMALVLIFLTTPLAYVPTAALAAILISSALGLFDFASLRRYYLQSPAEFRHAIVAMLGVMTIGVLQGVLIAVALALLRLLVMASRPNDAVLGTVDGQPGVYAPGGTPEPGLLIYRFDGALLFFNADHFLGRLRSAIEAAPRRPEWVILDMESMPVLDITGIEALERLRVEFEVRGIVFALARGNSFALTMLERSGLADRIGADRHFPTVHHGAEAFRAADRAAIPPGSTPPA